MRILGLLFLISGLIGCNNRASDSTAPPHVISPPSRGLFAPGKVEAKFAKAISESQARKFVEDFHLTLDDFSAQHDSTHIGLIEVPVGQEQAWVDSLKQFPTIVVDASRVALIYVN